ncbi:hypothetical protein VNO77_45129 [Canavalia gladiata]|uniref:Uncharacterized protein n=1 Tax=Canavalia gladiata TaxID=3824 RepID=A0AAN9PNR5_CANGL
MPIVHSCFVNIILLRESQTSTICMLSFGLDKNIVGLTAATSSKPCTSGLSGVKGKDIPKLTDFLLEIKEPLDRYSDGVVWDFNSGQLRGHEESDVGFDRESPLTQAKLL